MILPYLWCPNNEVLCYHFHVIVVIKRLKDEIIVRDYTYKRNGGKMVSGRILEAPESYKPWQRNSETQMYSRLISFVSLSGGISRI